MAIKNYFVIEPVRHDGIDFAPGSRIDLEPEHAAPLLKAGVISSRKPEAETAEEKPAE